MVTITISGSPGSGKSTVAQLLQEKTGLRYVYSGELFRQKAQEHHMTLEEFGTYCERHREVDEGLDKQQLAILRQGNVIVEGRLSGWLAYKNKLTAYKILITADVQTRAQRIVNREGGSVELRKKEMQTREKSETKRYLTYYKANLSDPSFYDLVIDSSDKTPEEIVDIIMKNLPR